MKERVIREISMAIQHNRRQRGNASPFPPSESAEGRRRASRNAPNGKNRRGMRGDPSSFHYAVITIIIIIIIITITHNTHHNTNIIIIINNISHHHHHQSIITIISSI
jgi:hypothetical protein